jgi:hypothetical protein
MAAPVGMTAPVVRRGRGTAASGNLTQSKSRNIACQPELMTATGGGGRNPARDLAFGGEWRRSRLAAS